MGRKIFILFFWTIPLLAGEGSLFITNHTAAPVIVKCSVAALTGKQISNQVRVIRNYTGPLAWPGIQDLFPRETLRGLVFHIAIELYDDKHHLLNRSQLTHIFYRNPNAFETEEVYADLTVHIREDYGIDTLVGKSR